MATRTINAILACAVMVLVAAVPLVAADIHTVVKGEKGPNASAMTWEFVPADYGKWSGKIVNNGLRWLVVDVYDNSTGIPVEISHQRIRFAAYDAYPTGEVVTSAVPMVADNHYLITVTPNGPRGSSCTVEDVFMAAQPPVAMFTVTSTYLNVVVDASASYDPDGTIVAYSWNWGDGTPDGSGMIATHTYAAAGDYTVTLTVRDNDGLTDDESKLVSVTAPAGPPVASFTATMDWMSVSVDASASYDPEGLPLTYAWNWGDGETGSGMTATHTYLAEQAYTITLTVTDADMLTATATQDVVARAPHPPVASFTVSITHMSVAVDASGSSDDRTIVSYSWDWGDGTAAGSGKTATHTYAAKGMKTITLTVTDDDGLVGSASQTIEIVDNPPVAAFTYTVSGTTVVVDASSSTDDYGIVSYVWDWGDGTTGTGVTVTHVYANTPPGTGTSSLKLVTKASTTGSVIMAGPPPPPFMLFGMTYDNLGNPVFDAVITITDLTTGDVATTVSVNMEGYPYYEYNLNDLPSYAAVNAPIKNGDIIKVEAAKGSLYGMAQGTVDTSLGFLYLDVTLVSTGPPPPYDVTITLTVTDELGQTSSVSRVVTVYPQ